MFAFKPSCDTGLISASYEYPLSSQVREMQRSCTSLKLPVRSGDQMKQDERMKGQEHAVWYQCNPNPMNYQMYHNDP